MKEKLGSNLPRVKVLNQASIRRIIYLDGPITRNEIATRLNLTLPTITTNVNSMLANGIVREQDEKISAVDSTAGRKSALLEIVPTSKYFIGIEILLRNRTAVIVDFKGNVIKECMDSEYIYTYDELIASSAKLIKELLEEPLPEGKTIQGIGISFSGLIDTEKGILKSHRQWGFFQKPVVDDIRKATGFTGRIVMENDACTRAISYNMLHHDQLKDAEIFAYLFTADGISCPILRNSDFTTSSIGQGELSYMLIKADQEDGGRVSNLSGIRSLIDTCIQNGVKELEEIKNSGRVPNSSDIIELQKNGNETVGAIIKKAMEYLGIAVANVDNIIHPSLYVVGGKIFEPEQNRKDFEENCRKHLVRSEDDDIHFIYKEHNRLNGAIGAATVVIQYDLGDYIEA